MANRFPTQQSQMHPRIDFPIGSNVPSAYPRSRAGMWPHSSTHQQLEEQNEKQREYLKQQQKLRLMTASSAPQSVSADALIENLLGKKETFKPRTTHQMVQPVGGGNNQHKIANVGSGLGHPHMKTAVGYPAPPVLTGVSPGPSSAAAVSSIVGNFGGSLVTSETKSSCLPSSSSQMESNMQLQKKFAFSLPAWLEPTSPMFPQLYRQVWKMVGQDKGLVDTARIFPLLLTSGLPTDILGFIWGLANRKVAGQLTEQELYIVLALVALAQSGCTFSNLSVLNLIPQPPIPNLKIVGFDPVGSMAVRNAENIAVFGKGKMKREDLNLGQLPSAVTNAAIAPSETDDAGFDEFTDFQSAATVTTEPPQLTSIKDTIPISKFDAQSNNVTTMLSSESSATPNIMIDSPSIKCPSVMVVSSGGGRGIGSRLANHSLGTPKQKKVKHHHHHHHHRSQPQVISNIAVSIDEDFSDFQQANTSDHVEEVFPKCSLKPATSGKTYLLKESAIRSEIKVENNEESNEVPKMSVEGSRTADNAVEEDMTEFISVQPHKAASEVPKLTSDFINKASAHFSKETKSDGDNLMAVEEDKYSALRNLCMSDQDTNPEKTQKFNAAEPSPVSDEFGDFLFAEPAQIIDDSFADIASRKSTSQNVLNVVYTDVWKTSESPQVVEFQVDDWGDFKGASFPEADTSSFQAHTTESGNVLNNTECDVKIESDVSVAFMNLDLSSNVSWNQTNDLTVPEKGKEYFQTAPETTDLNLRSSWDFKFKDETGGQSNINLNISNKPDQRTTFQGFLGKIYDDIKPEHDTAKVDIFCSSPDDQLENRNDNFDIDIQTCGGAGDDEFGEFVGPDTWPEEQKYITTKDILFDGHLGSGLRDGLYGDSQSVSSLELPPLALSRHGSVPSLDLKIFPTTAEKNGGNGGNQPWDMSPQGIDNQLSEWQRCLQSCLTLLVSAVETFNNVSSGEVLDEVVRSAEGKDYLHNILEVAGVSRRVECSYRQLGNSGEYKQLDLLLSDIENAWSSLEQYYMKANISVELEPVSASETSEETSDDSNSVNEPAACCGVCLADVNLVSKANNRNISQLEYGGHIYHSVCANLWVNCVDSSLPGLATGNGTFL